MIDRKCKVTLGGLPQKIHVKGDETKPVLLFLHGGPGVCNRHTVMTVHADLQKEFLVVAWDQRGSGGSYRGAAVETLTIDRLVDDAHELVLWLCREYGRKKVYLLGGSWGSELGTWLAYRYPEHIAAFVGFGQVVNGAKNEELSYQFALDEAQQAGDEKSIAVLKRVGPPVMGVYKGGFDGMMAQRRVMMKYGGYSQSIKAVLDRSIGYLLPYFRLVGGAMHHQMRCDNPFALDVHFYGGPTKGRSSWPGGWWRATP